MFVVAIAADLLMKAYRRERVSRSLDPPLGGLRCAGPWYGLFQTSMHPNIQTVTGRNRKDKRVRLRG